MTGVDGEGHRVEVSGGPQTAYPQQTCRRATAESQE